MAAFNKAGADANRTRCHDCQSEVTDSASTAPSTLAKSARLRRDDIACGAWLGAVRSRHGSFVSRATVFFSIFAHVSRRRPPARALARHNLSEISHLISYSNRRDRGPVDADRPWSARPCKAALSRRPRSGRPPARRSAVRPARSTRRAARGCAVCVAGSALLFFLIFKKKRAPWRERRRRCQIKAQTSLLQRDARRRPTSWAVGETCETYT